MTLQNEGNTYDYSDFPRIEISDDEKCDYLKIFLDQFIKDEFIIIKNTQIYYVSDVIHENPSIDEPQSIALSKLTRQKYSTETILVTNYGRIYHHDNPNNIHIHCEPIIRGSIETIPTIIAFNVWIPKDYFSMMSNIIDIQFVVKQYNLTLDYSYTNIRRTAHKIIDIIKKNLMVTLKIITL